MLRIRSVWLFYRERYIFVFFNIALFFIAVALALIILQYPPTDDLVTLHYNYFYGIDYVGSWFTPYFYTLYVLLVVLLNFILSFWIFTRDKYMSYYLNFASVIVSTLYALYIFLLNPYT